MAKIFKKTLKFLNKNNIIEIENIKERKSNLVLISSL